MLINPREYSQRWPLGTTIDLLVAVALPALGSMMLVPFISLPMGAQLQPAAAWRTAPSKLPPVAQVAPHAGD